jgi:hypothetical protein
MAHFTPEQIGQARQMDLLTYLQHFEPDELLRLSGNAYTTRSHDSLHISNGKWNWFSRGIGGRSALDYLIKVRGMHFADAVEQLLSNPALIAASPPLKAEVQELILPERNFSAATVEKYLRGRGIPGEILDHCIRQGILYEDAKYHSAVFVGADGGTPRYAAIRSTRGNFKGDARGSSKQYSFRIIAAPDAPGLHVFESAIDLLSYAALRQMDGDDWRQMNLLSLAGVYKPAVPGTIPAALRKYLDENGYGHIEIECDGNVSFENAKKMRDAGANIFVAGTSSIYAKDGSFEENIRKLREAIQ